MPRWYPWWVFSHQQQPSHPLSHFARQEQLHELGSRQKPLLIIYSPYRVSQRDILTADLRSHGLQLGAIALLCATQKSPRSTIFSRNDNFYIVISYEMRPRATTANIA